MYSSFYLANTSQEVNTYIMCIIKYTYYLYITLFCNFSKIKHKKRILSYDTIHLYKYEYFGINIYLILSHMCINIHSSSANICTKIKC